MGTLGQNWPGPCSLPHRDRTALRDAAPALRGLTASIDAQAD